jgi:hypothetical protein
VRLWVSPLRQERANEVSENPFVVASRRHILNHTALKKNPSLDCEALRKPTTTGTSERSERESYNHKKALY